MAGYTASAEGGTYVHLTGGAAWLQMRASEAAAPAAPQGPYLSDANARLAEWAVRNQARTDFALKGYAPLAFSLANAGNCQVRANQRLLTPIRAAASASATIQHFRLSDAAAQIQLQCPAR